MKKTTTGFTIVELLIVIVVIAILAAISVVAYNGVQSRARTTAHAHAAAQTEREIMTYALQQNSESISLSNTLVGYKVGIGNIDLLRPITGTPDITMYVVYDVVNTSGYFSKFAQLTPVESGNYFMFQTSQDGTSGMGYRIDTPSQFSLGHNTSGLRTPGARLIGWLQATSSGPTRSYGFNQAAPLHSAALMAYTSWNFTGLSLVSMSDGTPQIALVFNAAHDQATRQQVISWLAHKYGVSL